MFFLLNSLVWNHQNNQVDLLLKRRPLVRQVDNDNLEPAGRPSHLGSWQVLSIKITTVYLKQQKKTYKNNFISLSQYMAEEEKNYKYRKARSLYIFISSFCQKITNTVIHLMKIVTEWKIKTLIYLTNRRTHRKIKKTNTKNE